MAIKKIILQGVKSIEVKRPEAVPTEMEQEKEEVMGEFMEDEIGAEDVEEVIVEEIVEQPIIEEPVVTEPIVKEKIPWWLRWVQLFGYDLIKRKEQK